MKLPLPILLITLTTIAGCKEAPSATPATAAAAAPARMLDGELDGVTFKYPADWKLTRTADGKGVNVTGPSDGDWEPNLFFEIQPVQGEPEIDEQLSANAEMLGTRKEDYRHRNTTQGDHPNGFKFGRIEYTNSSSEGSVKVPLQQWSILVPMGKQRRLQIQAAAAAENWSNSQPTFEKIFNSVQLKK